MISMRVTAIASMIVVSAALGLPPAKAVEIVGAGKSFKCTPVAVWDGDGPIWCAEGPRIRISGVAAREMDGTCRANQPCPAVGALEARDRLVKLFGGATGKLKTGHITVKGLAMTCISEGGAGGIRTAAWCKSPVFGDLSCAVVVSGGAVRWSRYWGNHSCN